MPKNERRLTHIMLERRRNKKEYEKEIKSQIELEIRVEEGSGREK